MNEAKRPLIPQFSLRWILALTAALAVVSLVVAQAIRGVPWAGAITIGLVALICAFVVYAGLFAVAWLAASIAQSRRRRREVQRDRLANDVPAKTIAAGSALVGIMLALLTFPCQTAWAASGGVLNYPLLAPGKTNTTGLTLAINTSWVDACGYRPVTVELKSITGLVTADRVFTFRFVAGQWQLDSTSTMVTQVIEMPAGSSTATAVIAVPQRQPWTICEWSVFEDGDKIDQLSSDGRNAFVGSNTSYFGDGAPPTVLALSGRNQISTTHLTVFGQSEESIIFVGGSPPPMAAMAPGSVPVPGTMVVGSGASIPSLGDLPTRWIDYSGIDIVLTSLDELQKLAKQHPSQWQAIQNWMHVGGILAVYDAGLKKWERLEELESLAGADSELAVANGTEAPRVERGWILPHREISHLPLNGVANYSAASQPADDGTSKERAVTFNSAPFLLKPYGAGMIAAIRSDDTFKGDSFPWPWFYNTLGPERWQWHQRHGISLTQENHDFWNFLIPGVGAAPVMLFQVLITLFVLGIGPVNYYLLRRIGKLNLMVISVPICAVFVTGALLLYALVADGLTVRLRARSITHLDQRIGEASCWARLSYYAGLRPAGGLKFSERTVVYPLQSEPTGYGQGAPRELNWRRINRSDPASPLEQQLAEGWLNARTPTQFVTIRNRKSNAKLVVNQTAGQAAPQVANQLGVNVRQLLLIDETGKHFTAAQLSSGQSVELSDDKSQVAAATALINSQIAANEPRLPINAPNNSSFFGINSHRVQPYRTYNNYSQGNVQQSTGVMERWFRDFQNRIQQDALPARSYVAIVETSPEMEPGTPAAREEASFHVIVGQW